MVKLYGDMHTHTVASTHAYSTINENCQWAEKRGMKVIAMTDHATSMADAPHRWHFENMCCLPRKICGVTVLRGIEADIMDSDGNLDMSGNFLKNLEWVVASMHNHCYKPVDSDAHTRSYLGVCKNLYVDVIGHCTTDMYPFDYEKVFKAFKEYDKLIEINESSIINKKGSAKNSVEALKICKKFDIPVIIDSDSHYCENVGYMPLSLKMVEDLDFPERLIINSDWEKIREFVLKKRPDLDI